MLALSIIVANILQFHCITHSQQGARENLARLRKQKQFCVAEEATPVAGIPAIFIFQTLVHVTEQPRRARTGPPRGVPASTTTLLQGKSSQSEFTGSVT